MKAAVTVFAMVLAIPFGLVLFGEVIDMNVATTALNSNIESLFNNLPVMLMVVLIISAAAGVAAATLIMFNRR